MWYYDRLYMLSVIEGKISVLVRKRWRGNISSVLVSPWKDGCWTHNHSPALFAMYRLLWMTLAAAHSLSQISSYDTVLTLKSDVTAAVATPLEKPSPFLSMCVK